MKSGILIYLSGPMTPYEKFTLEHNIQDALRYYYFLLNKGYPTFCPHLCAIDPVTEKVLSYEQWMEYDFRILDFCTHIFMMPTWEKSLGAKRELEYAQLRGIPILYSIDELDKIK